MCIFFSFFFAAELDPSTTDVLVAATLLKTYFRELPAPLMTFSLFDEWVKVKVIHRSLLVQILTFPFLWYIYIY